MFGAKLKRQMLGTLHFSVLHFTPDPRQKSSCVSQIFQKPEHEKANGGQKKKNIYIYMWMGRWGGHCSGRGLHEHVFLSLVGHKTINIVVRPPAHPQLSTNQPPVKCETQKLERRCQQQQPPETEAHNSLRELITQQLQLHVQLRVQVAVQIHGSTRAVTARNPVNRGKNHQRNDMDTHIKCAKPATQLIFPRTKCKKSGSVDWKLYVNYIRNDAQFKI